MIDKIAFFRSICPAENIYEYIGLYFDQLMALSMIIPSNISYKVIETNVNQNTLEVVIELADTSTASWVKSIIDSTTLNNHVYQIYDRSLTINTFLTGSNLLKICIG